MRLIRRMVPRVPPKLFILKVEEQFTNSADFYFTVNYYSWLWMKSNFVMMSLLVITIKWLNIYFETTFLDIFCVGHIIICRSFILWWIVIMTSMVLVTTKTNVSNNIDFIIITVIQLTNLFRCTAFVGIIFFVLSTCFSCFQELKEMHKKETQEKNLTSEFVCYAWRSIVVKKLPHYPIRCFWVASS